MSTDATPTDDASPGLTTTSGKWRATGVPSLPPGTPLLFSPICRRRLPNTVDEANAYAGPPA